ncbi:Fc.00g114600.m01.CDS01 [Cosmosporella sp. VM-42]
MTSSEPEPEPLINNNPQLQSYYTSLESRVGYKLFLGDTRHFGFYDHDTYWPFPIGRSLRAMEDKQAESLGLPSGARVLDAGCGVGHVAIRLAKKPGYRIQAIDIVDHHVEKAKRNVACAGLPAGQVSVRKMDYHHLETLDDESFDGIYTMETFVHATDPKAVLAGFYRILRPGGRISQFEYDHDFLADSPEELAKSMRKVNEVAAMPMNDNSHPGVFKQLLEEAGFVDVVERDYSENIKPMTRLFYLVAYVPWLFITFLHLEKYFINTVAGVGSYRGHGRWRYVVLSATKPGGPIEEPKTR